MATKNFNARISLKYDSYANWIANDPVLLVGEVAIATIPTKKDGIEQVPAVVMKAPEENALPKCESTLRYGSSPCSVVVKIPPST